MSLTKTFDKSRFGVTLSELGTVRKCEVINYDELPNSGTYKGVYVKSFKVDRFNRGGWYHTALNSLLPVSVPPHNNYRTSIYVEV